jgi:tRNA (guanine37-N1)-methyltransferase
VRLDVITLFPDMVRAVGRYGVTGRAQERGIIRLECWNPRDYTRDRHRTVDDRPYGGGPGMVMKVEPLQSAVNAARAASDERVPVIYLSPQGRRLDQAGVSALARRPGLIIVAGRYEGVDERFVELEVDEEWSIGDYVLSGGELAAMVMVDAVTRLLPGALGDEQSAARDSFMAGLLDCPHYTRPEVMDGLAVPEVLLRGHHGEIERWRRKQALGRTWLRRRDLLETAGLDAEARDLLEEFIEEHGAAGDAAPRGESTRNEA